MVKRAKELTEDLLEVVRAEHEKARQMLYHQQHELQMVQQGQYGYNVCWPDLLHFGHLLTHNSSTRWVGTIRRLHLHQQTHLRHLRRHLVEKRLPLHQAARLLPLLPVPPLERLRKVPLRLNPHRSNSRHTGKRFTCVFSSCPLTGAVSGLLMVTMSILNSSSNGWQLKLRANKGGKAISASASVFTLGKNFLAQLAGKKFQCSGAHR